MTGLLAIVRRAPVRVRWSTIIIFASVGLLLYATLSNAGLQSGLSYVGGLVLVGALFEFGSFNIRLAGRHLPELSLAIAMISYLTTALVLALVLIASSPRVVDGVAVAVGLFAGVTVWLAGELAGAWVVDEDP